MTASLVIRNCKVVTSTATVSAGIAVDDGKIVAIATDRNLPSSDNVIDAGGNYLLPGIIDVHVHFREPGYTHKEDFWTGSEAAAAGGVTTVVDMPNNVPPTCTADAVQKKIKIAQEKSLVNFGFHAGVVKDYVDRISEIADVGVLGFKLFMGETFGNVQPPDDGTILEAFEAVAATGLRVGVHAENDKIRELLEKKVKSDGAKDIFAHIESRSNIVEAEAISRAIMLARKARCMLHIFHVSTAEGVELVRAAKAQGQPVTAETGPHYLLFERSHIEQLGTLAKINPPVRGTDSDRTALWKGLADCSIDMIATDHSPHTKEEKIFDDVWKAASGFAGVETSLPLMLTQVNNGLLTINQLARISSENPARAYGMYPKKGAIRIGSDADLTLVDLDSRNVIRADRLHSKTKLTPFEGWRTRGKPILTIIKGQIVARDGEIVGKHGTAELVTPSKGHQDHTQE